MFQSRLEGNKSSMFPLNIQIVLGQSYLLYRLSSRRLQNFLGPYIDRM